MIELHVSLIKSSVAIKTFADVNSPHDLELHNGDREKKIASESQQTFLTVSLLRSLYNGLSYEVLYI